MSYVKQSFCVLGTMFINLCLGKMPLFNKFCCLRLKTGCKILGFIGLLTNILFCIMLVSAVLMELDQFEKFFGFQPSRGDFLTIYQPVMCVLCGNSGLGILANISLLIGAFHEIQAPILTSLVLKGLGIAISISAIIVMISVKFNTDVIIGFIILVIINSIIWLTVFSYRQLLRVGNYRIHGIQMAVSMADKK